MAEVLIYGATGYTAKLCAREMLDRGIEPILAARNPAVCDLAASLGTQSLVFSLDNDLTQMLANVRIVVNLAGSFDRTQPPLIRACIAAGCHYLDIAGEVEEMRSAFEFDTQARQAGVMLMPGSGFGVVPTDIAAKLASELLPDATHLKILYATKGGASRGTLKTVLKNIARPGVRRVNGEFQIANPAQSSANFTVANENFTGVYNPWRADLFTAGISTGIPNIETYTAFPAIIASMMQGRSLWLRDLILKLIKYVPEGPSVKQLQSGSTYVKAIVSNGITERSIGFKGAEAYLITARSVTAIASRILAGNVAPGFQTPAYYGKNLLYDLGSIDWD